MILCSEVSVMRSEELMIPDESVSVHTYRHKTRSGTLVDFMRVSADPSGNAA